MSSPSFTNLIALVAPKPDWGAIWPLWACLGALDDCPQDPMFHAEGDVGTHTRMVVDALVADCDWAVQSDEARGLLFWTAVLHDIGKPAVTRKEDGRITSRGHSRVGSAMARRLLWEAGAPFAWREALCGLIAAHQLPFWLIERPDPRRLAVQTSWTCRADHLCLHATADARGRVCADQQGILDNVALARATFEEAGCLDRPFPFANDESRVSFFEREGRDPHFAAYEDFRCEVTVMAGLPGSGKDRWIAMNMPDHPVVSLDAIREETRTAPTANQGQVIQAAHERAREFLRARRDFVWNGTNVTRQIRGKVLRLLRDYGARIRVVYVEVPPDRLFRQNTERAEAVPEEVIRNLADRMEPPAEWEAHEILRVLE